jgi:hypothetical protein
VGYQEEAGAGGSSCHVSIESDASALLTCTGGGAGVGAGAGSGSGSGGATETTLQSVKSALTLGPLVRGVDGSFGSEAGDALKDAQDEYSRVFTNITGEMSSLFNGAFPSGGRDGLPAWDFGTVKGSRVVIDMAPLADSLSIIGNAIMGMALFSSVFIVLSKR